MSCNLGRCVPVQTFRPPAPQFNRTVERYPEDGILGRLQNGREHLLAPWAGQHEILMCFQNGVGVQVVRLGFPQARGGTCERFSKPKLLTPNAGLSLSLSLDSAACQRTSVSSGRDR